MVGEQKQHHKCPPAHHCTHTGTSGNGGSKRIAGEFIPGWIPFEQFVVLHSPRVVIFVDIIVR